MPGPNVALDAYNQEVLTNQQEQENKQNLQMNALNLALANAQEQTQLADIQAETQLGQYGQGLSSPGGPSATSLANQPTQSQNTPAQTFPLGTNPGNGTPSTGGMGTGGANAPSIAGNQTQVPSAVQTAQMPSVGTSVNLNPADYNNALALKAAQLGRPNLANKYWQQASAAQEGALKMATAQNAIQAGNLKRISDTGQLISQYLGSAQTPEQWENGINQLAAEGIPQYEIDSLKKMPFSPQMAQALGQHAITAYQNAQLQLKQLDLQQKSNYDNARLNETIRRDRELHQWHQQQLEYKARNDKQGTTVTAPNKNDLDTSYAAIQEALYDGGDVPDDAASMVGTAKQPGPLLADVASRAKQLVRSNRGMDMSTAAQHAIAELQQSGQLKKAQGTPNLFQRVTGQPGDTTTTFKSGGNSAKDALPDPGDPGQRVVGKYYNVNGQVRQWLGQNPQSNIRSSITNDSTDDTENDFDNDE
jgi:hypothetical protein